MSQISTQRDRPAALLGRCVGAGGAGGGLITAVDTALGGGLGHWADLVDAAGLGIMLGICLGAALGLLLRLLRPLRATTAAGVWLLLGLAAGTVAAAGLGVFAKLGGPRSELAALSAAGCGLAGLLGAAVAATLQPSAERPYGWLGARSRGARLGAAALLGAVALALAWAEARASVLRLYPVTQLGLRLSVWYAALLALLAVVQRPGPLPGRRSGRLLGAAGLAIAAGATIHFARLPAAAVQPWLARSHSALVLGLLRGLSDVDADGYSSLFGGGDCAPFDSSIHPGATDIPGNGSDENCRLGDAPAAAAGLGYSPDEIPVPATPARCSVALITIDSVRADHTTVYGYGRPTTPHLARWAPAAAVFDRAYTTGGWTSLAIGSLLRGVYPRRLRWSWFFETSRNRLLGRPDEALGEGERIRRVFTAATGDPHPPLAWWLSRRGLRTVAVVDDGESELLSRQLGTGAGFDTFVEVDSLPQEQRDDAGTADEALRQLAALPAERPFFLWVHFFGPHGPNTAHPGAPSFGAGNIAEYDHEIAFADQQLGRLLPALEARAGLPVAVIVAADHGEALSPLGRGHGLDLLEGSVRIPLLIRAPGFAAGRVSAVASLIDVLPTVLALTGTPPPPGLDGIDLARPVPGRVVLSDTWRYDEHLRPVIDLSSATDGRHRLVLDRLQNAAALHDVRDPAEPPRNLLPHRPQRHLEQALWSYLEQTGGRIDAPPRPPAPPE